MASFHMDFPVRVVEIKKCARFASPSQAIYTKTHFYAAIWEEEEEDDE